MNPSSKDLEKLLQREDCFKHTIRMAFQDMISWLTLVSILEEMTPTIVECKQLIKVLLDELQNLKQQKQVENTKDMQNVYCPEPNEEKASVDIEILEDHSKLDDLEMNLVQDIRDYNFEAENTKIFKKMYFGSS